jgi:hypothetical protein
VVRGGDVTDDEKPYVICMAVSEYDNDGRPDPIPSMVVQCAECSCDVYISISTHPLVTSGEYLAVCNACAAKADPSQTDFSIHPSQLDEIASVPGLFSTAKWLTDAMNRASAEQRKKVFGFWARRD